MGANAADKEVSSVPAVVGVVPLPCLRLIVWTPARWWVRTIRIPRGTRPPISYGARVGALSCRQAMVPSRFEHIGIGAAEEGEEKDNRSGKSLHRDKVRWASGNKT